MTRINAPFTERPTRFIETDNRQGWHLKRYEITLDAEEVSTEIRAGAEGAIDRHLRAVVLEPSVGFVVMHAGEDAIWLLINLWHGELLHQVTLSASLDTPGEFAPVGADGPSACVWELRVIAHEREAYVRHVLLAPASSARFDAYLLDTSVAHVDGVNASMRCERRATIEAFNGRWGDGDVEGLMELLAENPVYRASTGPEPGKIHRGQMEVRAAFERVIASESALGALPANDPLILIDGERGVSSWSYRRRDHLGNTCLIEGVDLWVFEQGRIALKDAYRKAFPDVPADTRTKQEPATCRWEET